MTSLTQDEKIAIIFKLMAQAAQEIEVREGVGAVLDTASAENKPMYQQLHGDSWQSNFSVEYCESFYVVETIIGSWQLHLQYPGFEPHDDGRWARQGDLVIAFASEDPLKDFYVVHRARLGIDTLT
jgi:hypothetical protein